MANVGSGLVVLIRSGKGTNNIGNTNHLDGTDSIIVDAINSIAKVASYEKVHILKINFLEIRILEIHCLRSRLCKQGQWSEVIQLSLIDLNCELPTAHPFLVHTHMPAKNFLIINAFVFSFFLAP